MSRLDRVMTLLDAMSDEERVEFFDDVAETYCTDCGAELPDADSKEPDHDCPVKDDEDEDEGDDREPDSEDEEEDEAESDENANDEA